MCISLPPVASALVQCLILSHMNLGNSFQTYSCSNFVTSNDVLRSHQRAPFRIPLLCCFPLCLTVISNVTMYKIQRFNISLTYILAFDGMKLLRILENTVISDIFVSALLSPLLRMLSPHSLRQTPITPGDLLRATSFVRFFLTHKQEATPPSFHRSNVNIALTSPWVLESETGMQSKNHKELQGLKIL